MSTTTQARSAELLAQKIGSRTASVAVIGCDDVGLPLANAMHAAGFAVSVTNHRAIDWRAVAEHAPLVVDTRNQMAGVACVGRACKA